MGDRLATVGEFFALGSRQAASDCAEKCLQTLSDPLRRQMLTSLSQGLSDYPASLKKELPRRGPNFQLAAEFPECPEIAVVDGGATSCLALEGGHLVALNAGDFFNAVLFNVFATREKPYAPVAAAAVLALSAFNVGKPIAFQAELYLLAYLLNPAVTRSIMWSTADAIVLHEIGHSYVETHGHEFLPMEIAGAEPPAGAEISELRYGAESNSIWNVATARDGRWARLLLPSSDRHEIDEFAPDVFSFAARGVIDGADVETEGWMLRYRFWSSTYLFLEACEKGGDGGPMASGLRTLLRHMDGAPLRPSHPWFATRADVVRFYLEHQFRLSEADRAGFDDVQQAIWSNEIFDRVNLVLQDLELDPGEPGKWTGIFDSIDARTGGHHEDLSPRLKALAARSLGELTGLALVARSGKLAPGQLASFEDEISSRIVRDLRESDELEVLQLIAQRLAGLHSIGRSK